MTVIQLTDKQKIVFETLNNFILQNGMSPTYKELAIKLNLSVPSSFKHLKALEKKGYVSLGYCTARSIRILDKDPRITMIETIISEMEIAHSMMKEILLSHKENKFVNPERIKEVKNLRMKNSVEIAELLGIDENEIIQLRREICKTA